MWPECPEISTQSYMIKLSLFKSHCVGLEVAICNDKICNHWFLQDVKQTNASCISLHILKLTIFTHKQFWSCSYLAHFFWVPRLLTTFFPSAILSFPRHAMHSWFDDGWLQHWDEWLSSLPLISAREWLKFDDDSPPVFFSGKSPLNDYDMWQLLLKALVCFMFFQGRGVLNKIFKMGSIDVIVIKNQMSQCFRAEVSTN